jgi:molybdopterin-guanine dinucleotide biosynthesis protein A
MQNSHIENLPIPVTGVTGVLLAGGKSRRMGVDKTLLRIDGQPLFERSLELLQRFFPHVLIAGDRPDLARSDIPAIADLYPGSALGGLYTGLQAAATDWIFVAPCDMPYPDSRVIHCLLHHRQQVDAVVPRTPEGYEPVFALYHKNCLSPMETMLKQQQYRIYDFYQRIAIRYIDPAQLPTGWERALINVNTPEQFSRIMEEQG